MKYLPPVTSEATVKIQDRAILTKNKERQLLKRLSEKDFRQSAKRSTSKMYNRFDPCRNIY